MTRHSFSGAAVRIDLGQGHTLRTQGQHGSVQTDGAGARALGPDALGAALAQAGLHPAHSIELHTMPAAADGSRDLAPGAAPAAVTLEVEVGEGQSCVLLVEERATGALSWVLPDAPRPHPAEGARVLAASLSFTLPTAAPPLPGGARDLPLLGELGQKVQSFLFDVTDPILGPLIHGFAKKWETQNRPSYSRWLGPDNYRHDDPAFPRLTGGDWQRLAQGPALLFVHGTFSTSAAFDSLQPAVMAELGRRYGGRVLAFNHPTMTADPRENAIAFLGDIPQGSKLEVDIVCHSRGGLVARQIAALGETSGQVRVRRIVFVGATNAGTALADDDHMVEMVSRFTTIARFVPEGSVRHALDALLLAVKVLGHGLLHDLEGLRAMNPNAPFLKTMNVAGGGAVPEYFAIASDFEPRAGTPFISLRRAEDAAADRVFGNAANDLVVPRDGVFAHNGAGGFPIGEGRCLRYGPGDGVIHTEFFTEARTGAQLLQWLEPAAAAARLLDTGPGLEEMARVLDTVHARVLAELGRAQRASRAFGPAGAAGDALTPQELQRLRPHVVNLSEGVFKQSGLYTTLPTDVDALVHEHIPRWAQQLPQGSPLHVVVWAHGGLVGERDGLRIALKHIEWWKANGVYPLYFVWETGLFDALRSILESVRAKLGLGARDLFDFTSDPIIERGVRALGGVHIWGAMKRYAELAVAANGGAFYTAQRLSDLVTNPALSQGHELQLHAVGHSAGAVFHAWFLPVARQLGLPPWRTLQLLAPAITVADFTQRLAPLLGAGRGVDAGVLYTMARPYEEDDTCIGIYRKSLLYLIHHALEPQPRTPILGLEISLRADADVAALYGLNGVANAPARVVWSVTDEGDGRSASRSTTHGGFDDDPATLGSVAANVLDLARAPVPYVGSGRALADWPVSDDWLAGVDLSGGFLGGLGALGGLGGLPPGGAGTPPEPAPAWAPPPRPMPGSGGSGAAGAHPPSAPHRPAPGPHRPSAAQPPTAAGGRRRALCVGIDAYPAPNTLSGCVNDAGNWHQVLTALGFEAEQLLEQRATRQGILDALEALIGRAQPGDVLVFQYSGHGTRVPDTDQDEDDGKDEALVPVDFDSGAFLVDDDLRQVFDQLAAGVSLTCFIDCCHSGTITRMLGRNADAALPEGDDVRARFLQPASPQWQEWMRAHRRFRQRERALAGDGGGGRRRALGSDALRWVNFSACDATEVAYESNGNGDFTRQATLLLRAAPLQATNRSFQDQVIAALGARRRQTPQLDCPDADRDLPLLQPRR